MKVLHCAALLSPPSGVVSQMESEQFAASQLGIDWHVRMFCPKGSLVDSAIAHHAQWLGEGRGNFAWKLYAWFMLRIEYHVWLYSLAKEYDIFVLRYYVHDPFQLFFLLLCKRPVYLVHHTLEVPELAMPGGRAAWLRSRLESWLGKYSVRYAQGTIGVTREILAHQALRGYKRGKDYLYPNGIVYESHVAADKREKIPELLFVAGFFAPWHGLDLLLKELGSNSERFVLHLVGGLSEVDRLRAESDERVILHGHQDSEGIRMIAARCMVGLSSFGLSRIGMEEACTLKVREYLMMGLPVYAGYREVLPQTFTFYRSGPPSIPDILSFARSVSSASREQVAASAKPYIDKAAILDTLYRALIEAQEGQS